MQDTTHSPEVMPIISQAPQGYRIEIFTQRDLLKQPFLSELREVINASYRNPGVILYDKVGTRLKTDTQLAEELKETGFTAVAFALTQNTIIGTASVKAWDAYSEGKMWKPPGHFEQFSAEEIFSGSSAVLHSLDESASAPCEGEFELAAVAIKPDPLYRKKGIVDGLIKACEEELKRRTGLSQLRVSLKVVREVMGGYWLKKGFRIIAEQYCPPLIWGFEKGFVLWAMER
ncbi:hypothetical protein N7475_007320 [Penicillium sp. IBT 31633x]|nr:hypothetical protein N7475_007320 [Penicillium sp. IBT 31633x]